MITPREMVSQPLLFVNKKKVAAPMIRNATTHTSLSLIQEK